MSVVLRLMMGGGVTPFVMFGACALNESGKLLKIQERHVQGNPEPLKIAAGVR